MAITYENTEFVSQEWLVHNAFSDRAKFLVLHAYERGVQRGMASVLPKILLLRAMLRWEPILATALLQDCGVDLHSLDMDVESVLDGHCSAGSEIDLRELGEITIDARTEANLRGDRYVSAEHIILALLKSTDPALQTLFQRHGLTYHAYYSAMDVHLNR